MPPKLNGKICLVTGASRGIGKGIALQLAMHGATCYVTGRVYETLLGVADEAKQRGASGTIIPTQCDHSNDEEVTKLFDKISNKHDGQLDLLVNSAYAAVIYLMTNRTRSFWDHDPIENWDMVNRVGLRNYYICTAYAARLMVPRRSGLIVNIGSVGGITYATNPAYGIGKVATDRMARDCATELRKHNVTSLALWPSAVKTELMLSMTKDVINNKEDGYEILDWFMKNGETTEYSGKCVSYLLADPNLINKTGKIFITADLASEYSFKDIDGRSPPSVRSIRTMVAATTKGRWCSYIPNWLRLPWWFCRWLFSSNFVEEYKEPSKYELK